MSLRTGWAGATAGDDAVSRTIATALLAGEGQKTSTPEDRDQLRDIVDMAIRAARDEATRAALTDIRDRLTSSTEENHQTKAETARPLLISLSVDVVGSTEAKRRLRDLASNEAWRAKLYEGFYACFRAQKIASTATFLRLEFGGTAHLWIGAFSSSRTTGMRFGSPTTLRHPKVLTRRRPSRRRLSV
ncbi:hypothetical protein [Rhizobium ruizarguesonis]|uniref:hypothetical protein n=1 Tax=Rhizobium ruizarguesonis TaxID=2081791 RepID=UPI00103116CB|nr:hypothetical protein [Rhizobium ruizarguesonis]TBA72907.1 hypothetical protein ELH56_35205 [Rhizobium ruizarguesonis]WSH62386.1 hypothetical protein U8P68_38020 [Rhizobium ruizarguesonis]